MVTAPGIHPAPSKLLTDAEELWAQVRLIVNSTYVTDVHTHLFPPEFKGLCLFGIDELLTYHYLIAETFRSTRISYDRFWQMTRTEQADLIWQTLFVENSPTSEAARGVVSVLDTFGLDTRAANLKEARVFFGSRNLREHITRVFDTALVKDVVMTNDPFNEAEIEMWSDGFNMDRRFRSSLRLDGLLNDWQGGARALLRQGVALDRDLDQPTVTTLRRFLGRWIKRTNPVYLAVSLPPEFQFPSGAAGSKRASPRGYVDGGRSSQNKPSLERRRRWYGEG